MSEHDWSEYVNGLPEASGTFEGTCDPAVVDALAAGIPGLMPVEVDTGDEPLPGGPLATTVVIRAEGREWVLPVDHAEILGGNRIRYWVRRPGTQP